MALVWCVRNRQRWHVSLSCKGMFVSGYALCASNSYHGQISSSDGPFNTSHSSHSKCFLPAGLCTAMVLAESGMKRFPENYHFDMKEWHSGHGMLYDLEHT